MSDTFIIIDFVALWVVVLLLCAVVQSMAPKK